MFRAQVVMKTYVATGKVSALKHELRDHAMELGSSIAEALFTSAESTEVLSSLRDDVVVEVESDAAALFCAFISFVFMMLAC